MISKLLNNQMYSGPKPYHFSFNTTKQTNWDILLQLINANYYYIKTNTVFQVRQGPQDMGATATYDLDTELNKDAQAVFQRSLEVSVDLECFFEQYIARIISNFQS